MTNEKIIIAIDPGLSGAIAILDGRGGLIDVYDIPVVEILVNGKKKRRIAAQVLVQDLIEYKQFDVHAIIEQVNAMPGQGVTSVFSFGQTFGIIQGILAGMIIPYSSVVSSRWKKHFKLSSVKDESRNLAMATWPNKATLFKRKLDSDRAEAALIGLYFLQTEGAKKWTS